MRIVKHYLRLVEAVVSAHKGCLCKYVAISFVATSFPWSLNVALFPCIEEVGVAGGGGKVFWQLPMLRVHKSKVKFLHAPNCL